MSNKANLQDWEQHGDSDLTTGWLWTWAENIEDAEILHPVHRLCPFLEANI